MMVKVYVSLDLVGCKQETEIEVEDDCSEKEIEVEDDCSEKEIEEMARDAMYEMIEWGYEKADPKPDPAESRS